MGVKKSLVLLGLASFASTAFASDEATFMSGNGYKLFLAYGVFHSFQSGKEQGVRQIDSLLSSALLTEGLKRATRVPSSDHGRHDAFPSGHATMAFAVATFQAETHPKEAVWWYLGAGLVGQSRIDLGYHSIAEVLAGAAVGHFVTKAELRSKYGFIIQPTPSGATVLGVSLRF